MLTTRRLPPIRQSDIPTAEKAQENENSQDQMFEMLQMCETLAKENLTLKEKLSLGSQEMTDIESSFYRESLKVSKICAERDAFERDSKMTKSHLDREILLSRKNQDTWANREISLLKRVADAKAREKELNVHIQQLDEQLHINASVAPPIITEPSIKMNELEAKLLSLSDSNNTISEQLLHASNRVECLESELGMTKELYTQACEEIEQERENGAHGQSNEGSLAFEMFETQQSSDRQMEELKQENQRLRDYMNRLVLRAIELEAFEILDIGNKRV